ncbi:Squalene synthetase [Hordeum vulgare]|nr:Squalene synthetase [Hordeum vulgare]
MGVLSRSEEVAALVRLKVAAGRIRRQIPRETHRAFAYDMLQRVSRSFALEPELRNAMHQLKEWEEDAV